VPASIRKLPALVPEAPTLVAPPSSPAPAATVCAGSSAHVTASSQRARRLRSRPHAGDRAARRRLPRR
jgi:hypothetical protein